MLLEANGKLMEFEKLTIQEEDIGTAIVNAAFKVYSELDSLYESWCLRVLVAKNKTHLTIKVLNGNALY